MAFVSFRANLAGFGSVKENATFPVACRFVSTKLFTAVMPPGIKSETLEVGVVPCVDARACICASPSGQTERVCRTGCCRYRARTARRPLRESHGDLLSEAPPATLLFVGEVQFLPHPGQVVWRLAICRGPAVFGVLQPLQPFDHLRTPISGLCRLTR